MILDIDEILPLPEQWSGDDSGGLFVLGEEFGCSDPELSHETISKITDQVAEEVLAWQRRPSEALYPVIYLDALVVKIKDGAPCATRPPLPPLPLPLPFCPHRARPKEGRARA
jgi:Transposase, Mutator family